MVFFERRFYGQGIKRATGNKLSRLPRDMLPSTRERIDVDMSKRWVALAGQNRRISLRIFLDDVKLDLRPVSNLIVTQSVTPVRSAGVSVLALSCVIPGGTPPSADSNDSSGKGMRTAIEAGATKPLWSRRLYAGLPLVAMERTADGRKRRAPRN